jgi:acyl-CoA thioester hydrolase
MEFLHQIHFDYKGLIADGFYLYISHIDIKYKSSAFLDDRLFIETESIKLGVVSGTFHQCVKKDDGTLCAVADVTWASVTEGARPARLPEKYMLPELMPEKAEQENIV